MSDRPDEDPADDLLDDLPPLESALDDDEAVGVDDDLEPLLGTLGTIDEAEQVGLDDEEAGMDFDPVTLLGLDDQAGGEEGESWVIDNEVAGDDIGTDGLDPRDTAGDEYGWTEDNEAGPLDDWSEDFNIDGSSGESEKVLTDDAGEVGVDDVVSLGGGRGEDDVDLPPLLGVTDEVDDEGMEALADDIDLAGDELIDGDELTFEEEARLSGAALPEPFPKARLEVTHLGPSGAMVYDVARVAGGWVAVGEELYRVAGEADAVTPVESRGLGDVRPTTVCPLDSEGKRLAVGTRLSGVLVSEDAGESFSPRNNWSHGRSAPEVAFFVRAERHADGARLWGRTRSGALFRSEDYGESWSSPLLLAPVAALADDAKGGVVVLSVPAKGPAQTARSDDGGHAWTMRSVPGLRRSTESETEYHIAADGPVLVVASDGHRGAQVSDDDGQSWTEVGSLPTPGAVCLVDEGQDQASEGPTLYVALFFQGADRGVVLRRRGGQETVVLDVRAERDRRAIEVAGDPEGDNRVFAIDGRVEAGYTILMVATGAGLFRLRVRHG